MCGGGGDTDRGRGKRQEKEPFTRTKVGHRAPSRPGFILRRPCPLRLLRGQTNPAICPLSHSGVASQAQPPPSANHRAPCKSPLPFSKQASASDAILAAPPPPHSSALHPRPPPLPPWQLLGDEGSAGRLMHMQIIFLIPPSSPALPLFPRPPRFGPFSTPTRASFGSPRLVRAPGCAVLRVLVPGSCFPEGGLTGEREEGITLEILSKVKFETC